MDKNMNKLSNELERTIIALNYVVEVLEISIKIFKQEFDKYKELEKYKDE